MNAFLQDLALWRDEVLSVFPFQAPESSLQLIGDRLQITTPFPCARERERYRELIFALAAERALTLAEVDITWQISAQPVQGALRPLSGVKNIIAVASGKGGVGKSTLSVNLALALQAQGAAVGLLDADLYGPSQAKMLGGACRPETPDGRTMIPVPRLGLQTLSIADLVAEEDAMIWRGPMLTRTLMQLLHETRWQGLDYLVIDLPPGTGDTQLTLAQQIPVSGALIVTTPQDIALIDAQKAKVMFDKVAIRTLGVVENMSFYCCPACGHRDAIFGEGGGQHFAQKYDLELLGQIPLDPKLRQGSDAGTPIVAQEPEGALSQNYTTIAAKLAAQLAFWGKVTAFPEIVMEK